MNLSSTTTLFRDRELAEVATVTAVRPGGGLLLLNDDGLEIEAASVVLLPRPVAIGDKVLLVQGSEAWVVGLLPNEEVVAADRVLRCRDGCVARVRENETGEESIQIEDPKGRLLFEYQPESKTCTLSIPEGDLELRAPAGSIRMSAAADIVGCSRGHAVLQGSKGVHCVSGTTGAKSELELSPRGLSARSKLLAFDCDDAEMRVDHMRYRGKSVHGSLGRVKWVAEKIHTVVGRLLERARNVYRHTEELHQTKAGRIRTLVRGSYRVKSHDAEIRSDETMKIDGKRIHLG